MYVDFLYAIFHIRKVQNDILKVFGKRIKDLRQDKNWSQEELANQTGFHRTYIGMIERGERNLSLRNIEIFANVFQMSMSELLKIK